MLDYGSANEIFTCSIWKGNAFHPYPNLDLLSLLLLLFEFFSLSSLVFVVVVSACILEWLAFDQLSTFNIYRFCVGCWFVCFFFVLSFTLLLVACLCESFIVCSEHGSQKPFLPTLLTTSSHERPILFNNSNAFPCLTQYSNGSIIYFSMRSIFI